MMQEYLAENARLRQLSKRYAAGELGLDEFRAERRAMITALEAGQVEQPVVLEPETAGVTPAYGVARSDITQLQAALPVEPEPVDEADAEPAPAAMDQQSLILLVILSASLLIALGMLVYVLVL